jgi:CTP:molybdopterin cytidylyltransferase MocA
VDTDLDLKNLGVTALLAAAGQGPRSKADKLAAPLSEAASWDLD